MRDVSTQLRRFAELYTEAWCSQDPERVASFFAEGGSLTINGGSPAVGREAIADAARAFMTAFPNLRLMMDRIDPARDRIEYHWTLAGTNTGPGGTGRAVQISGVESWHFRADGLIEESRGTFDADEYARQISVSG